jgi:hypothetical protein
MGRHLDLPDPPEPSDGERAILRAYLDSLPDVTITMGPRTRLARDIDFLAEDLGVEPPADN